MALESAAADLDDVFAKAARDGLIKLLLSCGEPLADDVQPQHAYLDGVLPSPRENRDLDPILRARVEYLKKMEETKFDGARTRIVVRMLDLLTPDWRNNHGDPDGYVASFLSE